MAGREKIVVKGNPEKMFPARPVNFRLLDFHMAVAPMPIMLGLELAPDEDLGIDEGEVERLYDQRIQELAPRLIPEVATALTNALQYDGWAWKDGSRDIFDTGVLAASANITMTGGVLKVQYSVPYADIIHNGGYIQPYGNPSARPVYLPGRPWIDAVLSGGGPFPPFDFAEFYRRNL